MGYLMGYTRAPEDIKKGDLIAIEASRTTEGYGAHPYDWKDWAVSDCDDRLFKSGVASALWLISHNDHPFLYPLDYFMVERMDRNFSNEDGFVKYATKECILDIPFNPASVSVGSARKAGFTHVAWYPNGD